MPQKTDTTQHPQTTFTAIVPGHVNIGYGNATTNHLLLFTRPTSFDATYGNNASAGLPNLCHTRMLFCAVVVAVESFSPTVQERGDAVAAELLG
ncbi:hypothetical protein BaRGS_00006409 [Batillaria attramentaria]|uniref:Uncharacterized protein n=1 Tax=Batillaria attramentaria TaxID=370345 RepID=A0ABD0LTR8_9CAEN